jgi:hypothetical protein
MGAASGPLAVNDCNVIIGTYALSIGGSGSGISNSVIIGHNAGQNLSDSSGSAIVLIGPGVYGSGGGTASDQLAIGCGFRNWLYGDSNYNLGLGNGLLDCSFTVGTSGQVLVSTGSKVKWCSIPAALPATPTAAGIVIGCTNASITALGCSALASGLGSNNVGLGNAALGSTTVSGTNNTAVGTQAATLTTTGTGNTAIGTGALIQNTTGSNNVAIGLGALDCTRVSGNVGVGFRAGCNITTGTCNVAIGPNVIVAAAASSCQLALGFSATENWLTGDSSKHIRPGAGIRDCNGNLGTAGQYLCTTGAALQWATPTTVGPGLALAANLLTVWGATTTAPSPGGGCFGMWCRQAGDKYYQIIIGVCKSAGGSAGLGDYLFTLPNGLQFNTGTQPPSQAIYTANIGVSAIGFLQVAIPGSTGYITDGSTTYLCVAPVVYSATQFRVVTVGAGNYRPWAANWFAASSAICMNMNFQFVST